MGDRPYLAIDIGLRTPAVAFYHDRAVSPTFFSGYHFYAALVPVLRNICLFPQPNRTSELKHKFL
jgi:hypothetical protein